MATNSVTTDKAREKLAKGRAGAITFPHIIMMAFGDGGTDVNGDPIAPLGSATALQHELLRRNIDGYSFPIPTTARYRGTIPKTSLAGETINEIALVDEDGDLVAIKTFRDKVKDGDMEMIFDLDDEF